MTVQKKRKSRVYNELRAIHSLSELALQTIFQSHAIFQYPRYLRFIEEHPCEFRLLSRYDLNRQFNFSDDACLRSQNHLPWVYVLSRHPAINGDLYRALCHVDIETDDFDEAERLFRVSPNTSRVFTVTELPPNRYLHNDSVMEDGSLRLAWHIEERIITHRGHY